MGIRIDDDDETPKKGGHGNTKLPFGLCQREGIEIQKGWTPEDAWKALEGKGYSAGETYQEIKKTGKVAPKTPKATAKKDYGSMVYDDLATEFEQHLARYNKQREENEDAENRKKEILRSIETLKKFHDGGDYNGETYEQVSNVKDDDKKNYWKYNAIKRVMDNLGKDAFERDFAEVEKEGKAKAEEAGRIKSFGELNEERAAILNALAEKAKEKYPKLTDCDTPLALESRIRGDDFLEVGDYTSMKLDYSKLHGVNVPGIAKTIDKLSKKFPKLKGMLPPPLIEEFSGNAYARVTNASEEYAQLQLSKYDFAGYDAEKVSRSMKEDVKSGFHPKGTGSVQGVVTHEYGHIIDGILTRRFKDELDGKSFAGYVLNRVAKAHPGMDKERIMESVSRYAVNNDAEEGQEFLAEAFAEYMWSPKPRPTAVEVGTIMKEFIDRL